MRPSGGIGAVAGRLARCRQASSIAGAGWVGPLSSLALGLVYIWTSDFQVPLLVLWLVETPLTPRGHEDLTEEAARGIQLWSKGDLQLLRKGVRQPDVGGRGIQKWLRHLEPGEQRRHALRRAFGQPWQAALEDARAQLTALTHLSWELDRDHPAQMLRLGEALHLIQDAYAPAHVARTGVSGSVRYVRHFGWRSLRTEFSIGPGRSTAITREHRFPIDGRDNVRDRSGEYKPEAVAAIKASQLYLDLMIADGKVTRDDGGLRRYLRDHLSA